MQAHPSRWGKMGLVDQKHDARWCFRDNIRMMPEELLIAASTKVEAQKATESPPEMKNKRPRCPAPHGMQHGIQQGSFSVVVDECSEVVRRDAVKNHVFPGSRAGERATAVEERQYIQYPPSCRCSVAP